MAADIVALVIGNNEYQREEDKLDTPVNDAQLMKRTLEALPGGADVKLLTDATREDIQIALNALKVRAEGAKLALVFYSGHGMDGQPDGYLSEDTFLLPVDANIPDVNYLDTRAISLGSVLTALKNTPVTARAVFLDCCRSGAPKATAALASSTKNFGDIDERVKAALGKAVVPDATLVAFAASPGRKAAAFLSESDENSPFTKFLTEQLATGSGNLRDLVEAAAEITEIRTGNRQVPYVIYTGAASAIRQITFRSSPASFPVTTPAMTEAETERRARELAARMAPSMPTAPSATEGFTNTLGMTFVPVPGTQVQFCVHETRVADFAAFIADGSTYDFSNGAEPYILDTDGWNQRSGFSWKKPGFPQTDDHPVSCVSWKDAQAFCTWLSRKEGRTYRLPTDHEWSVAVGIGSREDASASPESKGAKIEAVYPWGGPPSSVVGNYCGEESKDGKEPIAWTVINGYRDGHSRTAPVMSFTANKFGIHDLGGNLWEWCEEWFNAEQEYRVLRGGSWSNFSASGLLSSCRSYDQPGSRKVNYGFRLVLVVGSGGSSAPPMATTYLPVGDAPLAPAMPADLPATGFFECAELFASGPYAAYNTYSQTTILKQVQEQLKKRGHYTGYADGAQGPGTQSGIIAYQQANGLPVSGRLDPATLRSLGLTGIQPMIAPKPVSKPISQFAPPSPPRPAADDFFISR